MDTPLYIVYNHIYPQNTQQEDQNQQMMVTNDDLLTQFKNDIDRKIKEDADKSILESKAQTGDYIAEYNLGCITAIMTVFTQQDIPNTAKMGIVM